MTAVVTTNAYGSRTNLSTTAFNSLAAATLAPIGVIATAGAVDVMLEVSATSGSAMGGNKQVVIYAQVSADNTNFSGGPSSGTTLTDVPLLFPVAVIPMSAASTAYPTAVSLLSVLGYIPPYVKLIAFNDTGNALAASGHSVNYSLVTNSSQ